MSKADEMFKELGYEIDKDENRTVIYKTNCTETKIYLCVFYNTLDTRFRFKLYEQYCDMELLKAINEKVKELRLGEQLNKEIKSIKEK